MQNESTPHTTGQVSLEQAGIEAAEGSTQNQQDKRAADEAFEQKINESARVLTSVEAVRQAGRDVLLTGAIAATGVGFGALGADTLDNHIIHEQEQNQQWSNEAEQNAQQIAFENGLNQNKVSIEVAPVPAPTESTLPSPTQLNPEDLPPEIPSPITR